MTSTPEAVSTNGHTVSATLQDTIELLDNTIEQRKSVTDEQAYNTYASALASIREAHEDLIVKTQKVADWFQEQSAQASNLAQQMRGTPKSVSIPKEPSSSIVLKELKTAEQKLIELQQVDQEIAQWRDAIRKEEDEIAKRNDRITTGIIVYVIGVVIVGALSQNFAAALLWPVGLAVIAAVLGILGLMAGNS